MLETLLNYDLYDSSHPRYSEEYPSMERDKEQRFQYRVRERLEQRLSNPREPEEYLTAISDTNRKLRDFFDEDGHFDVDSYIDSDVFQERQILKRDKLLRKIIRDINHDIDKQAAETISQIKITGYALQKAQYIATRVSQLSDHAGKGKHYEIGMYALDDSLVNREPDITIRDVIIGHEQVIKSDHCNITPMGKLKSFKEVKSQGKRIVGFGHSHGEFDVYFSEEEDKETIQSHFESWGISKNIEIPEIGNKMLLKFFFAFVVNDRNDEPAYSVMVKKPRFYYENGQMKSTSDVLFFERIPRRDSSEDHWPVPKIVERNHKLSDEEKTELDSQIIDKAIFNDGTRLSDCYKDRDVPLYEEPLKREISALTLNEKKPDAIKTHLQQQIKQKGTDSRLLDLETRCSILEEQVQELQEKIRSYEIFSNKSNYSACISSYYANLINSDNESEMLLGTISKILAGDYYDGNKRIWTWDDRIKIISTIYQDNEDLFSKLDTVLVERLIEILDKNSYLKRKYNDKLEKIIQLLT